MLLPAGQSSKETLAALGCKLLPHRPRGLLFALVRSGLRPVAFLASPVPVDRRYGVLRAFPAPVARPAVVPASGPLPTDPAQPISCLRRARRVHPGLRRTPGGTLEVLRGGEQFRRGNTFVAPSWRSGTHSSSLICFRGVGGPSSVRTRIRAPALMRATPSASGNRSYARRWCSLASSATFPRSNSPR